MHADTIFTGGRVHAVARALPHAEALAVAAGRIVAVGSAHDVADLRGPATDVIELAGGMLLPGFQDAHAHPLHAGLATLRCDLYRHSTPAGYREEISAYAARHPERRVDRRGRLVDGRLRGRDADPTRARRDRRRAEPVCLETRDGHTAWLSTRALELAGIGADTTVPKGGVVDREPDGTPAGTVHELSDWLEVTVLPSPTAAEWDEALLRAQAELHRLGITACQEANATEELVAAYRRAALGGVLTLRIEGNLDWVRHRGDEQLAELVERRAEATAPRLRMRGAKLFQDGVAENFTAGMLEPYRDAGGETDNRGLSLYAPDDLDRIVTALDREGFQVHIHALGDRAVREALDALAGARDANGARDARHHLAHLQFVHPDDIPRFAGLGVAANVTPLWAVRSGYVEDLTLPFVSEAAGASMYPFGSLRRAGARLAFGSDWAVSSPDPLQQLEVAVTRREPGSDDGPFLPDERLDLPTAIEAATLGSAFVNGLDSETGTLEVGKLADLVVLDCDLLGADAPPPTGASVKVTLVEGAIVYDGR